jgi:hypothetical protein
VKGGGTIEWAVFRYLGVCGCGGGMKLIWCLIVCVEGP